MEAQLATLTASNSELEKSKNTLTLQLRECKQALAVSNSSLSILRSENVHLEARIKRMAALPPLPPTPTQQAQAPPPRPSSSSTVGTIRHSQSVPKVLNEQRVHIEITEYLPGTPGNIPSNHIQDPLPVTNNTTPFPSSHLPAEEEGLVDGYHHMVVGSDSGNDSTKLLMMRELRTDSELRSDSDFILDDQQGEGDDEIGFIDDKDNDTMEDGDKGGMEVEEDDERRREGEARLGGSIIGGGTMELLKTLESNVIEATKILEDKF